MRQIKSPALTKGFLMVTALLLSGCGAGTGIVIPDSLRAPCESTVDVSQAQTVGDLGAALIQSDADREICSIKKDAVVAIAESQNRKRFLGLF